MLLYEYLILARNPKFLRHEVSGHPECPERLRVLDSLFANLAIPHVNTLSLESEKLLKVHSKEMVQKFLSLRGRSGWIDPDTYFNEESCDAALQAAGMTAKMVEQIWRGEYRRGFSLVRPPGHHATDQRSMGFCLINNVAVAAATLLELAPQSKIAIVDFDLHHGNGTQDIFYGDPRVLFISSHRYPFYPGTGALKEHGEGKGKGTTVNLPLGQPYGTDFFLGLYQELVAAQLRKFQPAFILVSAGFDGHKDDPMQGFEIETNGFGGIAELLISAAEETCAGKIAFVLEGGYNPLALRESVAAVFTKMAELPRKNFACTRFSVQDRNGIIEEFLKTPWLN